jgi:hypothetical protein
MSGCGQASSRQITKPMINDGRGVPLTPRFLIGSVSSVKLLSFVLFLSVSASALHVALGQPTGAPEWK